MIAILRANPLPASPELPAARAHVGGKTIHILDVQAETGVHLGLARQMGTRTMLAVPLLREETNIGSLTIWRDVVEPFTERQMELVKTFADQAVIAIENVRLFQELTEALEQQTATSQILGVIASSPTDIQPVLDTVIANAVRLVGAKQGHIRQVDGEFLRLAAHYNESDENVASFRARPVRVNSEGFVGRVLREKQPIHVPDVQAEAPDQYVMGRQTGARTMLAVPLLREGMGVGTISIWRDFVEPFTDRQIELVETFADQAVIAIENVRLFKELQERNRDLTEALEQQTATSEILSVISSSPTDLQPVFETIVANARRLCGADVSGLFRSDGELLHFVTGVGNSPEWYARMRTNPIRPGTETATRRAALERRIIHVPDVVAATEFADYQTGRHFREGIRTALSVPLLRENTLLGVITISHRSEVRPFTDNQIALVKTFADQAVIAIENVRLFQELKESLEQQTATSEILGVIASSPTDIQPVLNVIAENAARICGTPDVAICRVEADGYRFVATYGSAPVQAAGETRPLDRGSVVGRAMIDRQVIHIRDVRAVQDDFWRVKTGAVQEGLRTMLAIPLLREGSAMGAIVMRRTEVNPFTDKQIALLKTFADQAVIAIENVRLFKELGERNAELREALEHQTATAEVLNIISRSPTDVQPVLDAIVESAVRVCGIDDVMLRLQQGDKLAVRAHYGSIATGPVEVSIDAPQFVWMREHGTLHIADIRAPQNNFQTLASAAWRTWLAVPLRQQGNFIGTLGARRMEVRPFTPTQIKLLETFADQAVIAIENVRLFQELKESLEQQTATSEILGVIASSPTDIQPVLDTVAKNAARLCEAADAQIRLIETDRTRLVASFGSLPAPEFAPISSLNPSGRAILTRQTLHLHDLQERKDEFPLSQGLSRGLRTFLSAPMIREGMPIGVINIRRMEVRPFSERHVKLLETFAGQAVIAIENVRLFKELGERNAELREALEHQTATAEVLGIISRSPTDVQPVLDAIVESAARVCGIDDVVLRLRESGTLWLRGLILVLYLMSAVRSAVMIHDFAGCVSMARCTFLTSAHKTIFPHWVPAADFRTYLGCSSSSAWRNSLEDCSARRIEVRPFTPAQIKLLETFADQAVIAIENVRLFQELKESLEQQTATSEILGVIASSPTDIQPVLDTIAENAARVCGAYDAVDSTGRR